MDKLGINAQFLISQIINFLLLFFIFSKFLYKPILKLLEERRKKIAETLENSAKLREELTKVEEERKKVLAQVRREGEFILQKQKDMANAKKEEMLEKAEAEAKRVMEETKAQMKREEELMLKRVEQRAGELAVDITQKVLSGLDAQTQRQIIQKNLKKIGND